MLFVEHRDYHRVPWNPARRIPLCRVTSLCLNVFHSRLTIFDRDKILSLLADSCLAASHIYLAVNNIPNSLLESIKTHLCRYDGTPRYISFPLFDVIPQLAEVRKMMLIAPNEGYITQLRRLVEPPGTLAKNGYIMQR
jgi:hypothetical protein